VVKRMKMIRMKMADAAIRSGRRPDSIQLVAVSKTQPVEMIQRAVENGQLLFGESKIQEAMEKIPSFGSDVKWHLIGHLQRNKVKHALQQFSLIHSVDSISLASEISHRASPTGKSQDILLQVNVSGEASKFGVSPSDLPDLVRMSAELPGIRLCGLMTIPPYFDDAEESRPYFKKLRGLAEKVHQWGWPPDSFPGLSMGMSNDFEVAIEEGATIVRIGTALFGAREFTGGN
jgi:PLP dependent protein